MEVNGVRELIIGVTRGSTTASDPAYSNIREIRSLYFLDSHTHKYPKDDFGMYLKDRTYHIILRLEIEKHKTNEEENSFQER